MSRRWVTAAVIAACWLTVVIASPAAAEPATGVTYPTGATATAYSGLAFDACTAPPVSAITAWSASPFRALGVYIAGVNRTCAQPELTATWVTQVSLLRWRLLPIYKGLQPPCGGKPTDQKITAAGAVTEGTAAAAAAVGAAKALGMQPGTAVYNDIENYSTTDTACRTTVLRYLSAWTKELHRVGFVSGVYANLSSGAKHLSDVFTSTSYARPDALWIARYDGVDSLTGWAGIADTKWGVHQRAKQFLANRTETYGGVAINIDRDRLDAPVATLAYGYRVTSSTALNGRSGPSTSSPVVQTYPAGSTIKLACQTPGTKVGTTSVWDKLSNGTYVTDLYVSTPSSTTYSAPLPRCSYPYQIASADGLNERSGPGTGYSVVGHLPDGGLAWVVCQKAGSTVGPTKIWNKLTDGRWVSDRYVATPSSTSYTKPIPRC
jgi:uncharacterized protein YraI